VIASEHGTRRPGSARQQIYSGLFDHLQPGERDYCLVAGGGMGPSAACPQSGGAPGSVGPASVGAIPDIDSRLQILLGTPTALEHRDRRSQNSSGRTERRCKVQVDAHSQDYSQRQNQRRSKRWTPRASPPRQVRALLTGVREQGSRGLHLETFFGCLCYAAMSPAEAAGLRVSQRRGGGCSPCARGSSGRDETGRRRRRT
jgi:hypothetical protein